MYFRLAALIITTSVIIVAALAVIGNLAGVPMLTTWGRPGQTSLPTATCALLTAIVLFGFCWRRRD